MNPYKTLGLLTLTICSTLPSAAQKKQYTIAEATNGISTTLAPKGITQPRWRPGTHQFFYRSDKGELKMYDADTKDSVIRDTCCEAYKNRKIGFVWLQRDADYRIEGDSIIIHTMRQQGKDTFINFYISTLPKGASNLVVEPNSHLFAFTKDNNLYLGSKGAQVMSITSDSNKNIVNGQAVHRNEFGIDNGIFFSPKGTYLAYYRMDQTMVADYPVIDWSVTPATNDNVKYPMAGGTSHEVTLQVYHIATRRTTAIKTTGPRDQYLTSITWSPDEKYIYIGVLNRDQNHLQLNQYDAKTGNKVKTILQERDEKYVEPQHPLSFLPGSTTRFVWWSQRDGFMHLWLCDMEKNSMRCLTPGDYVVNDLLGFNAIRKEILLTSAREDPREKHGYAVNWETGKMHRLDSEPGTHNYIVSDDGAYAFDVYTGKGVAKRSIIRATDGSFTRVLLDSPNPLAPFDRPRIIDTSVSADDGTRLFAKLILPTNFDPSRKYPVIVYLYNGPHAQLIKNGFPESGNLWYEYLAQRGYVVWSMDGRGSANRGLKFEQGIFRDLGTVEMADQLRGVSFLKSLPYVDASRMGVHGWSYGGFMSTSLMLRHPGVFKAAVAGGPVMDWRMYEVMYGERYMDMPEQNPEGYKQSALLDKVKKLKGKLLIIHGAQDATVVLQHSIKFLKACVDGEVPVDFFVYPGHEHNVRGRDRVHLMRKVTEYFDQHL